MARNNNSSYEEETQSESSRDKNVQPRRPHKGGKIIREEPISIVELLACPLTTTCFRYQSFFDFCEMVERVKYHHEIARQFVINMENNMVHLVGVNTQVVPFDSQGNIAEVTTNQSLDCRSSPTCNQRRISL